MFNTFWQGGALTPVNWACLSSFVERGHGLRVFSYDDIEVPGGVVLEDARQILAESELFECRHSFSAFSNIFRYKLLLEQGGWWVDTDVYCLDAEIPDCRYAWALESEEFINGAILKFPAGDPALEAILHAAQTIGSRAEIQGQLGPRLLTTHLVDKQFDGHFGSPLDFYPLHWFEAHRFWTPHDRDYVLSRVTRSRFVHLWDTMFRYMGIDQRVAPPPGSFLGHILAHAGCLSALPPLDEERTQATLASIRTFLQADWVPKLSKRLLGYDVSQFRAREGAGHQASVAVVIPAFNMGWCLERALASCFAQSYAPSEIIVVDDASSDETADIVERVAKRDSRVRCLRLERNAGHLTALRLGLRSSTSEWAVLLDADDELTADSIERRVEAARRYHEKTGKWPQLVYGDLYRNEVGPGSINRFKVLEGHAFAFLSRELSLCQTSTIMLGNEAIRRLPEVTNVYNTDDEIVVAVGKRFPMIHAGVPVAVAHDHAQPTRMTNSASRRLRGIAQLVRNHRDDIVQQHGGRQLFLWRLRVLRAFVEWQKEWAEASTEGEAGALFQVLRAPLHLYGSLAGMIHARLTSYLRPRFEQMFF